MTFRYATVLFDLDGTLIDSIGLIVESFHHTFAHFGLPPRSDAEWMAGIGTPLRTSLAEHARDEATMVAMIEVYRAYNLAHHDSRVRAFPGATLAVERLAQAGVKLGLVTSKNRPGAGRGLRLAGMAGHIETLVCAEDVTRAKPDREPVDRAVALLGADPATTLFVGDTVHDMVAGRAAGVHTAAALWGPIQRQELLASGPDHLLEHPDDVVRLAQGADGGL